MSAEQIGPLDLEEIKIVRFPFDKELAAAGVLQAAAVAVTMTYGADLTPQALCVGLPAIVGTDVLQRVSGAGRTAGATYHLRCRATDDDGEAHVVAADLTVKRL